MSLTDTDKKYLASSLVLSSVLQPKRSCFVWLSCAIKPLEGIISNIVNKVQMGGQKNLVSILVTLIIRRCQFYLWRIKQYPKPSLASGANSMLLPRYIDIPESAEKFFTTDHLINSGKVI
ncbi:MAG: hypothetical protein OFPI_36340 [Osedax symbiont Rs2]|nr:MAG: hypothetical protein OFPI_36340 [Osedax symbiont Rs2]